MKTTKKNHSIWKEIVAPLCLFLLVTGFVLMVKYPAFAQTPSSAITNIGEQTNLPSYETTGHGLSSYEPGASNITSGIYYAIDLLKYAMGSGSRYREACNTILHCMSAEHPWLHECRAPHR